MSCFTSDNEVGEVIRPLDPSERFFSSCHSTRVHLGVVLSCRYAVPSLVDDGSLKHIVERAVARSVLEHTAMCVGLVGEHTKSPTWVRVDSLDMGCHVRWYDVEGASEESFDKVYDKVVGPMLDLPFEEIETRPPWRIQVIKPQAGTGSWIEILFSFSHAISDGIGGKIFHDTLLRNLRDVTEGNDTADKLPLQNGILKLPSLTKKTFVPPPQDLINWTYSPMWALGTLWQELRPPFLVNDTTVQWAPLWDGSPTATRWRIFHIDADSAAQITAACRSHKTTVTALLHAVTLKAFCVNLPGEQAPEFVGDTYVNLRRFVKKGTIDADKTVNSIIMSLRHRFGVDVTRRIRAEADKGNTDGVNEVIWEVAANVRAAFLQQRETGTRNVDVGLLKFVSDTNKFFEAELKKPRRTTWGMASMGNISNALPDGSKPAPDSDTWKINRVVFNQGSWKCGEVYDISAAGVEGGPISVTGIWEHGIISEELGIKVTEDIKAQLNQIAQESSKV